MKLMANRKNVEYRHDQHGQHFVVLARAGLPNIMEVLNQLFNTEGKTITELCSLLSTEQRTLSGTQEKREEKDSMHITFQETSTAPYTLSFETTPVHGCAQRSKQKVTTASAEYQKNIRHVLLATLSSDEYDQGAHNLLAVYMSQNSEDLREDFQKFVANKDIPYANLIDFYSLFDFDAEDVDLILFESVCSKLKHYPQLKPLLLSLIFELPDDTFYYYYNIKYLAKYKVWEIDTELIDTIVKLLKQINNEEYTQKAVKVLLKYQADSVTALREVIRAYKK